MTSLGYVVPRAKTRTGYIFFSGGFPLPNISALANMGCKRFPGEVIYHRR